MLKAAKILRNENTGLVFVGDGANRAALEASAERFAECSLSAVSAGEQIPHVMMAGDVHIITVKRGLEGVVVPSKLYSILAAGVRFWLWRRQRATQLASSANPDAAWRPIPTIPPPSPPRFASFASDPAGLPRWAAARGKPQKNMLE